MKVLYSDVSDVMYKFKKYNPEKSTPKNIETYNKAVDTFMKKLNELEKEFQMTIESERNQDYDGFVESSLSLYDNKYGYIGEIFDSEEEAN